MPGQSPDFVRCHARTRADRPRLRDNLLTTIDLTPCTKLHYAYFKGNLFTSLDFSNVTSYLETHEYNFNNNPNLTYVNLKNGQLDYVHFYPLFNCPNLIYICCDELDIATILPAMQQFNAVNVQLNTYCDFVPGGNYNSITGKVTLDLDGDGCDGDDIIPHNTRINITGDVSTGAAFTSSSGNYAFYMADGNYTITPSIENPYFLISPPSAEVNVATATNNTEIQNFCITPLGIHHDTEITLLPARNARPGFDAKYRIIYKNKGNQIESGTVNVFFDDAILDFVSAVPSVSSQTQNNLNWAYTNLFPFETREIDFTINVNSATETPPVNIDDILHYTATMSPIETHETPEDEVSELDQIVRGSLDPNDKICLEGNSVIPEQVGKYLHYIIHFQNSGTAPAENVVVKDVIDTSKFDTSSLQLTGSSHPQTTRITNNKVEFLFENINLPAESIDESGSHGYVAFKIKTKDNLVPGNSVSNTADIYFDYNFPITTNTATTTISLLAKDTFEDKSVSILPNPAKDKLHITAKQNIITIQLYDIQGRLIETNGANGTDVIFNISKNESGIYFVKIYTEKGVKVEKVIKE